MSVESLKCPECGAALLETQFIVRCPYCSALLHVQVEGGSLDISVEKPAQLYRMNPTRQSVRSRWLKRSP